MLFQYIDEILNLGFKSLAYVKLYLAHYLYTIHLFSLAYVACHLRSLAIYICSLVINIVCYLCVLITIVLLCYLSMLVIPNALPDLRPSLANLVPFI